VRAIILAAMLAAAALIALAGPGRADQDPCQPGETPIRFAHVVSAKGHPKGDAAAELARRVNSELDGRACMTVYPDSELFTDDEVLDALIGGELEMAAPSLSKFEPLTLKFRIFDLPFLFEDIPAVERFQGSAEGQALMQSMLSKGIRGLAYWHNGMKQISADRPLRLPSDAEGLKFRIQPSEVLVAQFEALGAEPVKLAFRDVYDALASGKVEGQENTWSNIYTKRFYEVQDGITESNHGIIDYLVITSDRWWRGLPADLRGTLEQILREVTHEYNRFSFETNEVSKARMIENEAVIVRLTPGERAAWVAAFEPVWRRFEGEIGAELIKAARAANRGSPTGF
jgi:C4-dicarboxylate-binding protein DctP